MKAIINYVVCAVALSVAIALTCGGGFYTLAGLFVDGLLYASGKVFPRVWKSFWVSNIKILSYFNCL